MSPAAQKMVKICLTTPGVEFPPMPARAKIIVDQVCASHELPEAAVRGNRHFPSFAKARWECWSKLRELRMADGKPPSFTRIATWFGCDHSTVIQGIQRLRECLGEEAA